MEDLFTILLFLLFVLAPLFESMRRKGKPQAPPSEPRRRVEPRPQPRPRVQPQPSKTEEISGKARTADESAAVLVPDDLWEILTGERRPPAPRPPTPPQPQPTAQKQRPWEVVYEPEAELELDETDEEAVREDVDIERRREREEAVSLETIARHEEPVIVSLETMPPSPRVRHAAFHERLAQQQQPVLQKKPAIGVSLLNLNSQSELQRAFVLQEVLGRPRGLE